MLPVKLKNPPLICCGYSKHLGGASRHVLRGTTTRAPDTFACLREEQRTGDVCSSVLPEQSVWILELNCFGFAEVPQVQVGRLAVESKQASLTPSRENLAGKDSREGFGRAFLSQ